jgi:hypothetical protein
MGYEQDFKYRDALKSLFDMAKTVSDNVFTNDRPAAVAKQMNDFIVVSLPGQLSAMTYGSGFGNVRTYCTIEVYVRQKKGGSEDLNTMDDLVGKVLSLFPVNDDVITASRPNLTLKGSDGLGFSATLIRADLVIK